MNQFKSLSKTKKIILTVCLFLLAAVMILYFITSQSGYDISVDHAGDKIVTGDITCTKGEYAQYLFEQYGSNRVIADALDYITAKEIKEDDDYKKELEDTINIYDKYSTNGIEGYAKSIGYSSKEEFINQYLIPEVKLSLLRDRYINDHLDEMIDHYQVASFKKIVFEKESDALSFISKITSEKTFTDSMKDDKYANDSEDVGIVTKNTSLDDNLLKNLGKISKVKKDGVYSKVIRLTDDSYAVLYIYGTNHQNTNAIIKTLSNDTYVQEDIEAVYLKEYQFKVLSKSLKKEIQAISDQYIN